MAFSERAACHRHLASSLSLLLGLAGASVGCSDDADTVQAGSGAGGQGSVGQGSGGRDPRCDSSFAPIDPTALLDDLEDANSQVADVGGRNGSWWLVGDGTGTTTPPVDLAPPPERILGGRCGSTQAIRVTGSGFTDWGAGLSATMKYVSKPLPMDASGYEGIMFWARVGETNSSGVRVQFQDSQTHPEGGICNPQSGAPDECYNAFGTRVIPLDTEWRLYRIPFANTAQRDFGYRADSLDTSRLFNIEWNLEPHSVFDLWIDDVWFYE